LNGYFGIKEMKMDFEIELKTERNPPSTRVQEKDWLSRGVMFTFICLLLRLERGDSRGSVTVERPAKYGYKRCKVIDY
jgi:hypothetical protein